MKKTKTMNSEEKITEKLEGLHELNEEVTENMNILFNLKI